MTIVRNSNQLQCYPFRRLNSATLALFKDAAVPESLPSGTYLQGVPSLLKLFDCYLDVTGQALNPLDMKGRKCAVACTGFVGALATTDLVLWSKNTRWTNARTFRRIAANLGVNGPCITGASMQDPLFIDTWNSQPRISSAIEYWSGWWVTSTPGGSRLVNLTGPWITLGPAFCRSTFDAIRAYWAGRFRSISNSASLFNEFFCFIFESNCAFLTGQDVLSAIRLFCKKFFTRAHAAALCLTTSRKRWNDWIQVVEEALIHPGIWPSPPAAFPRAKDSELHGSRTRIRITDKGVEVREKFLTDIPLQITDEKAIQLLIDSVSADTRSIVSWAEETMENLMERHSRARVLARTGRDWLAGGTFGGKVTVSGVRKKRDIPLRDLATTFDINGFQMFQKSTNFSKVVAFSTEEAGHVLGLPNNIEIFSFVYLLIDQHPEITEAFLLGLELYDQNGALAAFVDEPDAPRLTGCKLRRGQSCGEQDIFLTPISAKLIRSLLVVTDSLRSWMRSRGNPGWRRLLLTCSVMSKPSVFQAHTVLKPVTRQKLMDAISPYTARKGAELEQLVIRLTPTSFRASRALCEYFEEGDDRVLSQTLGHKRHKPNLLAHYLPASIQTHLKTRTIRKAQNLIVAYAMQDSPLLLEATDFHNEEELKEFLAGNTLRGIDRLQRPLPTDKGRVYVDCGEQVLGLLATIHVTATEDPARLTPEATSWSDFSTNLFSEIVRLEHDTRLQSRYQQALAIAHSGSLLHLITHPGTEN